MPNLQTFEEFYAKVQPGKKLAGNMSYEAMRAVADPQLAMFRVSLMPPKASPEALTAMRAAFVSMWKDPKFLADYSKVIKTEPILVSGSDGQEILSEVASVRPEVKNFLEKYAANLSQR